MSDSMQVIERMLKQATVRHATLASNLANVDTPGYKAKDVQFDAVLEGQAAALTTTQPGHITAGGANGDSAVQVTTTDSTSWADKNTVELDLEVAKMTENAMLFQAGVQMLAGKFRMLKSALRTR